MPSPSWWRHLADHEAAHAVAAHNCGDWVNEVVLFEDGSGHCDYTLPGGSHPFVRAQLGWIVSLAGREYAGTYRVGDVRNGCTDDFGWRGTG